MPINTRILLCLLALVLPASHAGATVPAVAPTQTPGTSHRFGLPDFTALVKRYGPAVVNISTKQSTLYGPQDFGDEEGLGEDSPLYDFFRRFFGEEGPLPDEGENGRSLGSGFILSPDGYVLTNAHVIEAAEEIIVRTSDRREFVARVIGADERSDMALLKVDADDLPAVKIGSAGDLQVGEWVLAIGSPFGFEHSATAGIVSAKGRSLPSEDYVPFIQTDVAINPGNSGGPLFNLDGEVVGINSQIYSRTGGFMGLSFAIPIDVAMDVVQQLKEKGRVSRGWLGVLIQDVTRELAETFGLSHPYGALIAQVLPDSPASAAGLRAGDIVLAFNGKEVTTSGNLPPLVGAAKVGDEAMLTVLRDRETIELPVLLSELPEDDAIVVSPGQVEQATADRLGLVVEDLGPDERERLGMDKGGVMVESVEHGPAQEGGIRAGDIIISFDNKPVTDTERFRQLLDAVKPGTSVAVLVQRGDGRMFYPVRIPAE
ncbi:MAG: DegQ family serine endoprotease [Thiohalocapsa sp.]|uniref:DegQ family serine endoprotease n=1 Tax=Thiohalocapsa sp. TaxID=2497641 RepID=UPI0025D20406|nr:DegQ family serine endoprotease [Thiohalocapsa sp.]MCG6939780.1 DegQ family serine endoprotease [Thiohalocapsa sp.]